MEHGHQRRALSAGGDVALAEIADDGDAGGFGQCVGCVELNGVAAAGLVADGLAVGTDGGDLRGVDAGFLKQTGDGLHIAFDQGLARDLAAVQFVFLRRLQCQKLEAQGVRHGHKVVIDDLHARRSRIRLAHQYGIDAVQAGAGHEADEVACGGRRCCRRCGLR